MASKSRLAVAVLGVALASGCATSGGHGRMSSMSTASHPNWKACPHGVPEEVCVRCKPHLTRGFKAKGDWCGEHGVPESQCLECNPDLDFSPPKEPPKAADVVELVREGEDLPSLEPHRVGGKVTIFDFYATWCPPCRKVDEHLYPVVERRNDVAIRRINVVSWDTPVAERYLADIPELPLLVVYGKDGRLVERIYGAKLADIDRAIQEAGR